MKISKYIFALLAATFMAVAPITACSSVQSESRSRTEAQGGQSSPGENLPDGCLQNGAGQPGDVPPQSQQSEPDPSGGLPLPEAEATASPQVQTASYIAAAKAGVNIRAGAGTSFRVLGQAEKDTLYILLGETGGWYKTEFMGKTAYISAGYCTPVSLPASDNKLVERVIEEGCKLLGAPYVYGAVRLHDGNGNFNKYFTADEFDCSSLMQYIFYKGAEKLLQVNTRTQIYQGVTVTMSSLKRGDLMFFTNAQRKNLTGVEKVGHVALYLGQDYILHTSSDYAKIERLSAARKDYFIQGQRIL